MSVHSFDNDRWSDAAGDGAFSLMGYTGGPAVDDQVEDLLDAWFEERTQRIEGLLVLGQVRRLLAKLLEEGTVSPARRRQAGQLVRAIRRLQSDGR